MAEVLNANLEFIDNLKRALVWNQTNHTALTTGDITKLGAAAYMPASEFFVTNFVRAVETNAVTNAQIVDPTLITDIGTNAPVDQSFVDECTRAGLFGQLAGVVV